MLVMTWPSVDLTLTVATGHIVTNTSVDNALWNFVQKQFLTPVTLKQWAKISDVPAWLGLKATALAWLLTAWAFKTCRLGQSCQWWLALARLWPEPRPTGVKFITNQIYWVPERRTVLQRELSEHEWECLNCIIHWPFLCILWSGDGVSDHENGTETL